MSEVVANTFRAIRRLSRLAKVVLDSMVEFRRAMRSGSLPPQRRVEILHHICGNGLRAVNVEVETEGVIPAHGLLVSNHLSYLDILVYSSIVPCAFVSKDEVNAWPIFGRFARYSATIFVKRQRKGDSARANQQIVEYLRSGVAVMLFPEGTTTNGHQVLRFHSSMMQPAIDACAIVTPCAIQYELSDGDPGTEAAWWGDMTLPPHFLNLLSKREIRARVIFGTPMPATGDRKLLGEVLRHSVVELRDALTVDLQATA